MNHQRSHLGKKPTVDFGKYNFAVVVSEENPNEKKLECQKCGQTYANQAQSRLLKHQQKCQNTEQSQSSSFPSTPSSAIATPTTSRGLTPSVSTITPSTPRIQSQFLSYADKAPSNAVLQAIIKAISVFIFACRLPLRLIESDFFLQLLSTMRPGLNLKDVPSRKKLSNELLDEVYNDCISYDTKNIPEFSTLLLDGWKNKVANEKTVAFLLHNASNGNTVFVDSVTLKGDEHEDTETLYEMVS